MDTIEEKAPMKTENDTSPDQVPSPESEKHESPQAKSEMDFGASLSNLLRSYSPQKRKGTGAGESLSPGPEKLEEEIPQEVKTTRISVGRIQDGTAYLLTGNLSFVELPLTLLPKGIRKGNVLTMTIQRNLAEEEKRRENIMNIQREILSNPEFLAKLNQNS